MDPDSSLISEHDDPPALLLSAATPCMELKSHALAFDDSDLSSLSSEEGDTGNQTTALPQETPQVSLRRTKSTITRLPRNTSTPKKVSHNHCFIIY